MSPQRRRLIPAVLGLSALILSLAALTSGAVAGGSSASRDGAATHSYLTARFALDRAVAAHLPSSAAAISALQTQVSRECPGILSGAPANGASAEGDSMYLEANYAAYLTFGAPDAGAWEAFRQRARSARWRSAKLNALRADEVAGIALVFGDRPPNLCSDAAAWKASGYTTLPANTIRLAAEEQSKLLTLENAAAALTRFAPARGVTLSALLARTAGPRDGALARRVVALDRRIAAGSAGTSAAAVSLIRTLGLKVASPSESQGVLLGAGRTAAGTAFAIHARPAPLGCRAELEVSEGEGGYSDSSNCPDGHDRALLSCREGLVRIDADTQPGVASARLLLSGGRSITSRVFPVPSSLGGPAGVYHQAVRWPSPVPLSLTELAADGHTVHVMRLWRLSHCATR